MAENSPIKQPDDQTPPKTKSDRRRKTAIDPLDEIMATAQGQNPEDYLLPDELLGDPGSSLKYVCLVNFPNRLAEAIKERFGVSRQSAWLWCQPGKGIPSAHRDKLIDMTTRLKHDESRGILLPRNLSAEDLIRVDSLEGRPPFTGRNQFLLKLLSEVVSGKHEGLDLGTLDSLVESHIPQLGSPHRIWQWAYMQGGIPDSYVPIALKGMTHHGFHRCLDMNPTEFATFLRRYMVARKRSAGGTTPGGGGTSVKKKKTDSPSP